jgi:protein TonB
MFETVAPNAFIKRSRRVFYESLPISIAVHIAVVGASFATVFWNVSLPTQSPKMYVAYNLTQVPDPPPPPPPPKAEPPKPILPLSRLAPPPPAPTQIVAPTIIPDIIPEVKPPVPQPVEPPPPVTAVPAAVDSNPPAGVPGGQVGGTGHEIGLKGVKLGDDGRVYVDRYATLPLKEIDHAYPHYPANAQRLHLEGACVVRYTIGKNGRITDIVFLEHANSPIFDEETINTIKSWRWRPMTILGKPVEVVHEIEVAYQYVVR